MCVPAVAHKMHHECFSKTCNICPLLPSHAAILPRPRPSGMALLLRSASSFTFCSSSFISCAAIFSLAASGPPRMHTSYKQHLRAGQTLQHLQICTTSAANVLSIECSQAHDDGRNTSWRSLKSSQRSIRLSAASIKRTASHGFRSLTWRQPRFHAVLTSQQISLSAIKLTSEILSILAGCKNMHLDRRLTLLRCVQCLDSTQQPRAPMESPRPGLSWCRDTEKH